MKQAWIGSGSFLLGEDLNEMLTMAKIKREVMVDEGLQSIRRKYKDGYYYFIVNRGEKIINNWVSLAKDAKSAALFNPMTETTGMGTVKSSESEGTMVYLQLMPGESMILKTFHHCMEDQMYPYYETTGKPYPVSGTWKITFTEGGPVLPDDTQTDELKSWTDYGGVEVKRFSGTARYTVSFIKPGIKCEGWYLSLGRVAESARIRINGKEMGTIISEPFRIFIPVDLLQKKNILEVEVTNLMANRIAYMDQQGFAYKKFCNINFPSSLRENRGQNGLFTAAKWTPRESGLIGPVILTPVKKFIK